MQNSFNFGIWSQILSSTNVVMTCKLIRRLDVFSRETSNERKTGFYATPIQTLTTQMDYDESTFSCQLHFTNKHV